MNFKFVINIFAVAFLVLNSCSRTKDSGYSDWVDPVTNMKFAMIPKGEFMMGMNSTNTNRGKLDEIPHRVSMNRHFWIGVTEVTQQQWQKIMTPGEIHPDKPSPFRNKKPLYPVVSVSFYDIQKFIEKLNALSDDSTFRLPTEAEWEYACRANTTSAYHFGDTISDQLANYNAKVEYHLSKMGTFVGHPAEVASYPPNKWGLYDMHGNVWEWVSDWYAPYSDEPISNPVGPPNGDLKIIRGGSWNFGARNARSFSRRTHRPELWGFSIGFRLVREPR